MSGVWYNNHHYYHIVTIIDRLKPDMYLPLVSWDQEDEHRGCHLVVMCWQAQTLMAWYRCMYGT